MAKSGSLDQKNSKNALIDAAVSKVKPKPHRKKGGSRIGGRRKAPNDITNKKLVQHTAASSQKKNLPNEDINTEEDTTEITISMSYLSPESWDHLLCPEQIKDPLDYNIESEESEEEEEEESPMSYIPIRMRFRNRSSPLLRSPPLPRSPPFLIDMITLPLETIPEYEEIDDQV